VLFFVLSHDRGELSPFCLSGKQLSALLILRADPAPQLGEVPVSGAQHGYRHGGEAGHVTRAMHSVFVLSHDRG